jgi:hypothetical protein
MKCLFLGLIHLGFSLQASFFKSIKDKSEPLLGKEGAKVTVADFIDSINVHTRDFTTTLTQSRQNPLGKKTPFLKYIKDNFSQEFVKIKNRADGHEMALIWRDVYETMLKVPGISVHAAFLILFGIGSGNGSTPESLCKAFKQELETHYQCIIFKGGEYGETSFAITITYLIYIYIYPNVNDKLNQLHRKIPSHLYLNTGSDQPNIIYGRIGSKFENQLKVKNIPKENREFNSIFLAPKPIEPAAKRQRLLRWSDEERHIAANGCYLDFPSISNLGETNLAFHYKRASDPQGREFHESDFQCQSKNCNLPIPYNVPLNVTNSNCNLQNNHSKSNNNILESKKQNQNVPVSIATESKENFNNTEGRSAKQIFKQKATLEPFNSSFYLNTFDIDYENHILSNNQESSGRFPFADVDVQDIFDFEAEN